MGSGQAIVVAGVLAALPVAGTLAQSHAPPADDRERQIEPSIDPPTRHSVYIPYDHLREVFEREGRGVFLPYEQFEALWRAAYERVPHEPVDYRPPVDAIITETSNEATIERDVVMVKSTVRLELLKHGWNEVPLNLRDAAITAATINDEPARLVYEPGEGYKLLYEHGDETCVPDGPEAIDLKLEYAKAFTKAPGQNSVSFGAPAAPISRWRVHVPEAGVKVNLRPLIAATEIPATSEDTDETVVLAFVGAAAEVGINWTAKAEGATGLAALASVQAEQRVWIEEGVSRARADLTYTISRAEMPRLVLEVPSGHKVVNVVDANVRKWSVAEAGAGVQRINVELFEPARGTQRVRVELERFADDEGDGTFGVPLVRAIDVARQQGVIVARSGAGLRAEVTQSTGLMQLDAGELPRTLQREGWPFAYRYATVPFSLVFDVRRIEPFITADTLVTADLTPNRLRLHAAVTYAIERAGVFRFELDVPAGYDVTDVRGHTSGGAKLAEVDTFHLEETDRRLVVNLSRKAIGRVGLMVSLSRRLDHPELLSPSETAASVELAIPRVARAGLDRERGRIIVRVPESLHVNPGRTSGLRSVSMTEALGGADAQPGRGSMAPSGGLAFAYTDDPVELELKARRRQPYVTVRQMLSARIEPGVIRYDAIFVYEVRYSGVKSVRIDVPAELAPAIRSTTPGVRQERIEPAPNDVAPGAVAWRFSGQGELIGEREIRLAWEKKLEKLDVGKSVNIDVPRLRPVGADRAWGQIVLAKSETIDVHAAGEPEGVRPIDPQHDLMAGMTVAGAARAFEFHDDWKLAVTATHYELEEIKRTSIERALVRMVLTRSDQVTVQALYRMRSARQRLLVKLPPGVEFDTKPLRLNGRPVTLERGNKDEYFVPLVGQAADTPFLLELRYTVADPGAPLALPDFPGEPAVQKVYLSAYLPEERTLLGSRGPWTDEMIWRRDGLDFVSVPRLTEQWLLAWVAEGADAGVSMSSGVGGTFQTDGRRYLFSTLRPEAPPAGRLGLVTMPQRMLSVLVFALLAGAGLALLKTRTVVRWIAIGALLVTLLVVGTMLPTFTLEIMDGVLIAAASTVLVVWATWYLVKTRPRDPFLQALKKARREAKLAAAVALATPIVAVASPVPSGGGAADDATKQGGPSDA